MCQFIHDCCVVIKEDEPTHSLVPVFFFGYGDLRKQLGMVTFLTAAMTTIFEYGEIEKF